VALFNHPVHGELLIVSEWGGGRVQVFRDGSLFALYGGVSHAHDVVVDSEGVVYVTEYSSRKIKKFSLDGELVGGAEWSSSAVSLVSDASGGLHSVVMPDRVVVVLKEAKKRRSSQP
jgi:hypothetical protein